MTNCIRVLIIALCCTSCSTFTTTLDDCNNFYNRQEYAKYVDKCSGLAMGDAASQYHLYQIYKTGVSGSIDLPKANYFLQQSAILGYVPAMMDACNGYYTGSIGLQNDERALYWCNKAYQRGMTDAISYLANIYYNQKQYSLSLNYFLKLSNKSPQAEYTIGTLYLKTENNPKNGWIWIRKAYNHKNNDARIFVSKLNSEYGKCSIEDVYFSSSLSYSEAMQICKDVNDGKLTSGTAIMQAKKFFRTSF